uniref:Phage head morphogenesis domain-containing protein n=1 Tax=Meiothermus ruber TaxID=277 RepID=A0A7C3DMT2_MEIRU
MQYGFLPSDPRTTVLEREFRRLLESDLLSYWRTLTEPRVLARRLAALREGNRTTAQIIRQVQQEYGADYYSAERLVRTLYNSGANRAQLEALRAGGYTHKRWLTARDARVRRARGKSRFDHFSMDGVLVPIDEPFLTPAGSRLMYPGDRSLGAPPGEIVNCRCTVVGVMLESTMQVVEQEPSLSLEQLPPDRRVPDDRLLRGTSPIEVFGAMRRWLNERYPLSGTPRFHIAPPPERLKRIQERWLRLAKQRELPEVLVIIDPSARANRFLDEVVIGSQVLNDLKGSVWDRVVGARSLAHEWWHLRRRELLPFYPLEEGSADYFADRAMREATGADTRVFRRYPLLAEAVEKLVQLLGEDWLEATRQVENVRQHLRNALLKRGFPAPLVEEVVEYTRDDELWSTRVYRLLASGGSP